jgi:hypothetical protein
MYCPNCGQETNLALPTVRAMLREAAGRYVALDGRMWRTLAALLFRPGFLTREYLAGRRRRYIRPARLFLVLSLALLVVWTIVYLLRSIKTVYGGRWTGVVVRAMVIFVAYSMFYGIAVAGLVAAVVLLG